MAQNETKQIRLRLTLEQVEFLKEVQKKIGAKTLGDTVRFLIEFFMLLDKGEYAIFTPHGWKKAKLSESA